MAKNTVAAVWLGAAALLSALPARADPAPDSASAQFDFGLAEMQAGRYASGCPALEVSYRLDPRPGVLFTLAECETRWSKLASALVDYEAYLDLYQRLSPAERAAQRDREKLAVARKTELGRDVPRLAVVLSPDAPNGTTVARDGTALTAETLGVATPVELGEHVITATTPDERIERRRVTLWKGQSDRVVIEVGPTPAPRAVEPPSPAPADTPPPSPPPPPVPSTSSPVAAYVAASIGAAAVVTGGVTGGLAVAQKGTVDRDCPSTTTCTQAGLRAVTTGRVLGWTSTAAFGVGAVGAATALVLFLRRRPAADGTTAMRPRKWDASLGMDRGGAWMAVRGVW